MRCACGKPWGHVGRHVVYPTAQAKRGTHRMQQAAHTNTRYWRRRARGVCVDCAAYSPRFARCADCRWKLHRRKHRPMGEVA